MRGPAAASAAAAAAVISAAAALVSAAAFAAASPTAYPLLPLSVVPTASWPAPNASGFHLGEIRAVLSVPPSSVQPDGSATAQIYWRRRDNDPTVKSVFATTAAGQPVNVLSATVQSECGVVTIDVGAQGGSFYVYPLPYFLNGNDAWLHFSWAGCTNFSNYACVLGGGEDAPAAAAAAADVCADVDPAASPLVTGLETRDAFQGYAVQELSSVPAEVVAAAQAYPQPGAPFLVYTDDAAHPVRVFDRLPARWSLRDVVNDPPNAFSASNISAGAFFVFQIGIYAHLAALANITVTFTPLASAPGKVIPPASIRVFNFGGIDIDQQPFTRVVDLNASSVASLYVGIDVPAGALASDGAYTGTATVSAASAGSATVPVALSLTVDGPPAATPYDDIYSLARMKWLDSTIGSEDIVPYPYVPVAAVAASPLTVTSLNKVLTLAPNGLPASIVVTTPKVRKGALTSPTRSILADGQAMAFTLYDAAGNAGTQTVTSPAAVTALDNSTVSWSATSTVSFAGGGPASSVVLVVEGTLSFDSYVGFSVSLTLPSQSAAPVQLSDARLSYTLHPDMLTYVAGMNMEGSDWPGLPGAAEGEGGAAAETAAAAQEAFARFKAGTGSGDAPAWQWRWTSTTPSNKVWTGRVDAGLLFAIRGAGDAWESPMFGKDFPSVPFVPTTWGGVGALPTNNPYGVNATVGGLVVAFSGPRVINSTSPVSLSSPFQFDLAITPARPLNMSTHWANDRTFQVGYGTDYLSPQQVRAYGSTSIVTLHQGVPGVINGSLVNPYINYPFPPEVVPFLTNYTEQSNELGMVAKFYYTLRELSSHAAETFAFRALGDEILLDLGSPYVIPQPGYCQDSDCHGGGAYLHEHLVTGYVSCWQQGLGDGEIDAAFCTVGTSRLFNYYLEGLAWSIQHPPHMNGIYYDGIGFTRKSTWRIRRAADVAGASSPLGLRPHLDLHTGRDPTPPVCSYVGAYAMVDEVWNGEGFAFNKGPAYWMVEVSSMVHGLTGDRLGGATPSDDYKGMLWGMAQRNSAAAPGLWALWDAARLNETTQIGWWEDDAAINLTYTCTGAAPPYHTSILASVYTAFQSHALVSIASFCPTDESVTLVIDWDALGLDPASVTVSAPVVAGGVQPNGGLLPNATGPFTITSGNGLLLQIQAA
jgi:hypothetical protein